MLIPETLFFWIINDRQLSCLPKINMQSVRAKRGWKSKTPEKRAEFSKMRSEIQKQVFEYRDPKDKKKFFAGTSAKMKEFWANRSEEAKQEHIAKMSKGMKKAWDEGDENFGPRLANEENIKILHGNIEIIDNLPRINDYAGVVTASDMAQLNG